jgi:hypothetical protein
MQWSSTDQFGNLNVATSEATTMEELRPDLASLIEELQMRAPGSIKITVDIDDTELNGPDPENVSHILQAPKLACFHSDQSPEEIRAAIADLAGGIEVQLA